MKEISTYTHLHVHSNASLMDGVAKPHILAERAKELGMGALALTDHGTLAGIFDFQKACLDNGVKPILGNEMYIVENMSRKGLKKEGKVYVDPYAEYTEQQLADRSQEEIKEIQKVRRKAHHIILLAENEVGLKNLYKLNYFANKNGFYYKPRIDLDILERNSEGLIATTTCIVSQMAWYFMNEQYNKMQTTFDRMYEIFGKDRLFVELQPNELDIQLKYNQYLIEHFREKYDIKCVLTNDVHYARPEDNKVHEFLLSITTDDMVAGVHHQYLGSEEQMRQQWQDHGHGSYIKEEYLNEAIETTKEIATRCNALIDTETLKQPIFTVPEGYKSNKEFAMDVIKESFEHKIKIGQIDKSKKKEYLKRLKYEFDVIESKGFLDYFLITRDFMKHAKETDILCHIARGSAGGCLVSWLLEITELDPIKWNLSFERFLSPKRNKYPDIDNDIQDDRRDELKDYIAEKWGVANIAPIAVYGRYTANNLFREVCKAKDYPFSEVNKIAKSIDSSGKALTTLKTFKDNVDENPELDSYLNSKGIDEKEEIINLVTSIEGNNRNLGTGGAGTIISSTPLYELMPLRKNKNDQLVTEWTKSQLEKAKFLKVDLLGISTLSIIKDIIDRVGMTNQDLYNLPIHPDDVKKITDKNEIEIHKQIYENFRRGYTEGIFQFESAGITELLKNIVPEDIEDIIACNTLYRPASLTSGTATKFWKRKNGKEKIKTDIDEAFKDILKDTYGLIIYQEQVLEILSAMGLDYGDSDILRRAIEDKDEPKIKEYIEKLMKIDSEDLLFNEDKTKAVLDELIEHSGYLFNRSHCVAYSILAYWTMYLKTKYPKEFCEEILNHNITSKDKLPLYVNMALSVNDLKPSLGNINKFNNKFVIDGNRLRFSTLIIKGIGKSIINKIKKYKPKDGWATFQDFYVSNKALSLVSAKNTENLIRLGFFDEIPFNENGDTFTKRRLVDFHKMISAIDNMKKKAQKPFFEKIEIESSLELFNIETLQKVVKYIDCEEILDDKEYTLRDLANIESELLGFMVSGNDADFVQIMRENYIPSVSEFDPEECTYVYGKIANIYEKKTKKNDIYYNIKLGDGDNFIYFNVWTNYLKHCEHMLINGNTIAVALKYDNYGYAINNKEKIIMFDQFR